MGLDQMMYHCGKAVADVRATHRALIARGRPPSFGLDGETFTRAFMLESGPLAPCLRGPSHSRGGILPC